MQTLLDVAFVETDQLGDTAFRALQRLYHHYLTTESPLVDRDEDLAKIARLPLDTWLQIRSEIRRFFHPMHGCLHHARLHQIILRKAATSRERQAAGGKGGRAKIENLGPIPLRSAGAQP